MVDFYLEGAAAHFEGRIVVKGEAGTAYAPVVMTDELNGTGEIHADGGEGYWGGTGGGGRIAIYTWDAMDLPAANVTARISVL